MRPASASPARVMLAALLVVAPSAAAGSNLVVNGDFQTGALAPSISNYTPSATMAPPDTWNIVSFDTLNSAWDDFYDNTFGDASGFYMIVNGSDAGAGPAWAQAVSVAPEREYTLAAYFANAYPVDVASLEFRVDGVLVGEPFDAGETGVAGVWVRKAASFNSGGRTTVSAEIWDTNRLFSGNDYAIDDVSLSLWTCGIADLAPPFGLLDLADVTTFVAGFLASDPLADLDDSGLFDLTDVTLFVTSFLGGCP
ncbi:MAG: hypothetical protein H6810_04930 [Phycisphaeraceae bacterium]|nr:MAG: hypothetical protein H6810_04930 [Phycisphaeraceae bacterium]